MLFQRAQLVPNGAFSGGEFVQQQPSPYNPLLKYDFLNSPADYSFVPSPSSSSVYGRDEQLDQFLDDGSLAMVMNPCSYQTDCMVANKLYVPVKNEPTTLLECLNNNNNNNNNTGFFQQSAPQQSFQFAPSQQPTYQVASQSVGQEKDMNNYSLNQETMDHIKQLVMDVAINDIRAACEDLGISSGKILTQN